MYILWNNHLAYIIICYFKFTHPPEIISLKANRTHGRYMALNCEPNQKLTMTSLFNWHHTYKTLNTIGSISSYKNKTKIIKNKNKNKNVFSSTKAFCFYKGYYKPTSVMLTMSWVIQAHNNGFIPNLVTHHCSLTHTAKFNKLVTHYLGLTILDK